MQKATQFDVEDFTFLADDQTRLFASQQGSGPSVILLHGGGPDRQSIKPFAQQLANEYRIIFPDIRGYGQSICSDSDKHTWEQYAKDVISLIDHLKIDHPVLAGMGLGASIAERVAIKSSQKLGGLILISPETLDKEGEGSSPEEVALMQRCAEVALTGNLEEAWQPFFPHLAPVIQQMVAEAMPRTDPSSFSAAMHIVYSQRLKGISQLAEITVPTLIIPGNDNRHQAGLGEIYASLLAQCVVVQEINWQTIASVKQLAAEIAVRVKPFLKSFSGA